MRVGQWRIIQLDISGRSGDDYQARCFGVDLERISQWTCGGRYERINTLDCFNGSCKDYPTGQLDIWVGSAEDYYTGHLGVDLLRLIPLDIWGLQTGDLV